MRSGALGKDILGAEVTNVSPHGFWLLIDAREVFVSFKDFPWFAEATIREIVNVRRPSQHHLQWPALDIDLAVESLEHPDRYPLISRVRPDKRLQLARGRSRSKNKRKQGPRPRS